MDGLRARPDDETQFQPKAPGSFDRGSCRVQNWIDATSDSEFLPEPNRYHLFINYGCGWCHQVLMVRALRGLQHSIGITHVGMKRANPEKRGTNDYLGFKILDKRCSGTDKPGSIGFEFDFMRDIYNLGIKDPADWDPTSAYGTDQLTIPVLLDTKSKKVVSNDPAQILLMLDYWADRLRNTELSADSSLYPPNLQKEIEEVNSIIYPGINNGVYCCWFGAKTSMSESGTKITDLETPAFQEGFNLVQNALQWMDDRLKETMEKSKDSDEYGPYLCGTVAPTLADVRVFPHIFRFDAIYIELMLRNKGKRISEDFPNIQHWLKILMFRLPNIYPSCDLQFATRFYFSSMPIAESDAIYEREVARPGMDWLPTIQTWKAKREQEGVTEEMIQI